MSMSPVAQPFHILRKDARHLWPEILVSISLLIAFAWAEVQTWQPTDGTFNPALLAAPIIRFLIPIIWLVLTSRLVHDEELVGDRQFWITRPYTWYSLLASKILFLIVFICAPFLIMQAWLLHHAGLYPTHLLPAMLLNILHVSAVFLLPLLVLAAVTSTFVRYISSVLGGFIYVFAVIAIAGYNWSNQLDAPFLGYLLTATLVAVIVAALLIQYARRKTLIARVLLVALPLVVVVFAILAPVNALTAHRYPDTSTAAGSTIAFDSSPERRQPEGRLFNIRHRVIVNVPLQVQLTGLPDGALIEGQRLRIVIDGPNNFHYTSDWTQTRASLMQDQPSAVLPVELPEKVFTRIQDQPVALHIQLGTQTFHPGTPYSVTATEAPFPGPSHSSCTVSPDDGQLQCRFAFNNPDFEQVEATVHSGNCLTPGPQSAPAAAVIPPSDSLLAFSPVEITHPQLRFRTTGVALCPGTRVTFTPMVADGYGRLHLDIPAITLAPYAIHFSARPKPSAESQQ